ncbi:MAG: hypothetical protein M0D53_01070 [Flavobacterium sp. JAD_PAG50586_2]|nr:MAG: hypothetical protein M0D53_01070 [Flavobacterium sp. JAD_PAG50586_2]
MKPLLIILICLNCINTAIGQEQVFILVDISGSRGADAIKTEAKNQVYNLLLGQYSANGWTPVTITDKKITDLINSASKQPLIGQNSWVCIVPFGNKDTYKRYVIAQNKNHPIDFQNIFNQHYPSKFIDGFTYMSIAEAFTASLAKTYNINEYYMFVVTDGLGDQDDTNSKNTYDSFEENLLLEWNNASSSIVKNIGALTKSKYYINMRKVTNVKSSQIPTNPGIQGPPNIPDTNDQAAEITINIPQEAKKGKEYEIKSETVNINWNCPTCPQGIKYTVLVSQYEGGRFRETKKDLVANTATFKVPDGNYRITVSASNFPASSDTTFIKVGTSGFGWLVFLLILIAGIGIGYYFWNKKREEKIDVFASNKADDIFSKNSGGTTTGNSSNSDYF